LRMFLVQVRLASQNPKTPYNYELILHNSKSTILLFIINLSHSFA